MAVAKWSTPSTRSSNLAGTTLNSVAKPLTTGASAKIVNVPLVRLYPYSLRLSVVNNAGVALAASGNEIYVRAFNEDVT